MVVVIVSAYPVVKAQQTTDSTSNCFNRIEHELPASESITVYLTDSTTVRGRNPVVNEASGFLYLRGASNVGMANGLLIPFSKIDRVTFQRPSPGRGLVALIGLVAGAAAGGSIGAAAATRKNNRSGFMEFDGIEVGFVCGVFGGLVGAALGWELGKHPKITVNLKCQ